MLFTPQDMFFDRSFTSLGADFEKYSEMSFNESALLSGLIKKLKPAKILEIGVAAGASTCVILKAINEMDTPASFFSCDLSENHYSLKNKKTGFLVDDLMPHLRPSFTFFSGDIYPKFADEIGNEIDFVLLDAAHFLPGEILDFIAVLPNLSNNATVVLHDTSLHLMDYKRKYEHATRILFNTVNADKIAFKDTELYYFITNLSAFKITPDTHKNIANIFASTYLNWGYLPPEQQIQDYMKYFFKFYPHEYVEMIEIAYNTNKTIFALEKLGLNRAIKKDKKLKNRLKKFFFPARYSRI